MNEAIQVCDLHYSYQDAEEDREHVVFDGLNLSIEAGSFVAVLGHNGCGKSTLAKHFNAILLPAGGSVTVYGMDTKDEELLLAIRQAVGMVFQNPDNQIVANVVEEDVAFAPENLGVPPEEIRKRVDEALKAVNMYEFREHAPHQLSGGMQQRTAIARALAYAPSFLLMDEPFAALDHFTRTQLQKELIRLQKSQNTGILFVTHSIDEALLLGHKIAFIEDGCIKKEFLLDTDCENRDLLSKELIELKREILAQLHL